jgi:hypothetical protein
VGRAGVQWWGGGGEGGERVEVVRGSLEQGDILLECSNVHI